MRYNDKKKEKPIWTKRKPSKADNDTIDETIESNLENLLDEITEVTKEILKVPPTCFQA